MAPVITQMNTVEDEALDLSTFDLETLVAEIGRYLATIALFREEGCEPEWAGEPLALAYASTE